MARVAAGSRTVEAYARSLVDYLRFCERHDMGVAAAGRAEIAGCVRDLRERPGRRGANVVALDSGAGLANAPLQLRVTAVRLFYDFLVEERVRDRNPVGRGYRAGDGSGGRRGLVPRFQGLPWIPSYEQWRAVLEIAGLRRYLPMDARSLLRRGLRLELATLAWNVIGCVILAAAAVASGSVALAGFGIDSLIEILASTVVVWQLRGTDTTARTRPALRIIAIAFAGLAIYIAIQSVIVLASTDRLRHSVTGAIWLAITALVMFALAYGKADTGQRLNNPVLRTEARITVIDGALAAAVLAGVLLNAAAGWWWADPLAALVLVFYGAREARHAWLESSEPAA